MIKSQKGVTLTALVVYIVVFIIILTMMSTISNYFFKNVSQVKDSPKYVSEFNQFSMFFINDMKKNTGIKLATANTLQFEDGTTYTYQNNSIYRNETRIAKYVKSFVFTVSDYTQNNFTKKIVNVNTQLGNSKESITRNIDFVLRYW